ETGHAHRIMRDREAALRARALVLVEQLVVEPRALPILGQRLHVLALREQRVTDLQAAVGGETLPFAVLGIAVEGRLGALAKRLVVPERPPGLPFLEQDVTDALVCDPEVEPP